MSGFFIRLKDESRRLTQLKGDVAACIKKGADWDATVPAVRTLGTDLPVEKWYLAEQFLNAWNEWHTVLTRYLRFLGQPAERIPGAWRKLKLECVGVAKQLQNDSALDERIAVSWAGVPEVEPGAEVDAQDLFHEIVASHARLALLRHGDREHAAPIWRQSATAAWAYDRQVKERLGRLPLELREQLAWHLRHYRHAMLDASWLDEKRWNEGDEARRSAFEEVLGRPSVAPTWIGRFTDDLRSDMPAADQIHRVVWRIVRAIAETGYECFFEDVTSNEMNAGPDSPLGDEAVRVIRKGTPGTDLASANIIIGVAKGAQKRAYYGRPNVLLKLGETLTAAPAPVVAIVLVDSWDTAEFQREHFPAFRLHHARGHRFLFLLVGSPETQVAPLPLNLGSQRSQLATTTDFLRPPRRIRLTDEE